MEILHINALMFASEANAITVSSTDDVGVEIKVTTSDGIVRYEHASTYTPVDGVITFGDLADLINKCILLQADMKTISLTTGPSPYATLSLKVTDGENEVTATSKVFYCTAWNVSNPSGMNVWATQLRKRTITYDIAYYPLWLPLFSSGNSCDVDVAITYVFNGEERRTSDSETYTFVSGSEKFQYINASLPSLVKDAMGAVLYERAKVCYYEVNIWKDGVLIDSVQFTVDDRHYPQQSVWYFQNTFGLVECFLFRGREEESHTLEADYGMCGFELTALDRDVPREFKSNSGWLTKMEFRLLGELYRSPLVCRLDVGVAAAQQPAELRKVVVRDIDAVKSHPTYEPRSVDVTWRYADIRMVWQTDHASVMLGHNIFDNSFSVEFD